MNKFVIRYKELDPHLIYNMYGPEQAVRFGPSEESEKERSDFAEYRINFRNNENGFYDKLEASILKEGFHNPLLVGAGRCRPSMVDKLPKEMRDDHTKILVSDRNGGNRLWVAKKHNLMIPCIVSDFIDMFPEAPVLETVDEILQYFQDSPGDIFIDRESERMGVVVKDLPLTHLQT